MAQFQDVWNKFNPRERLTATGAGIVVLAWLVGLVARGAGVGSLALIGAIAVVAVLYLKASPNQQIAWPVAPSLIVLAISAIVAIAALLTLLDWLGYASVLGVSGLLSLLLYAAGGAIMVWGAWQEYQVEKPALPNFSTTNQAPPSASSTPTAPPAAAPPPAPAPLASSTATPPITAAPLDEDEAPPA